jgi:hypothetical protein
MAKKEAKTPVDLATMLGGGEYTIFQGKRYKVKPLKLRDREEFIKDELNFGSQFFTLIDAGLTAKLEKWMGRYLFDENDEPVTLAMVEEADWDIADLRKFVRMLVDISG